MVLHTGYFSSYVYSPHAKPWRERSLYQRVFWFWRHGQRSGCRAMAECTSLVLQVCFGNQFGRCHRKDLIGEPLISRNVANQRDFELGVWRMRSWGHYFSRFNPSFELKTSMSPKLERILVVVGVWVHRYLCTSGSKLLMLEKDGCWCCVDWCMMNGSEQ